MKKYIAEIEEALASYPMRTSLLVPEKYIGGGQSQLRYLGLSAPHLQQAMQKGFSFSAMGTRDLLKVWDFVWWNSDCFEVMLLSLSWIYDSKRRTDLKNFWPLIKKWSSRIDNWAHADMLSGVYSRVLEDHPELVYPTLVKWNTSTNPWLRRLSIVSLLYYARQREKVLPLKKILVLVEAQLDFDHYYVQKGVGWTLREVYNVYPKSAYLFVKKNIRVLSPQAYSAATEKMSVKEKESLKQLRRKKNSRI